MEALRGAAQGAAEAATDAATNAGRAGLEKIIQETDNGFSSKMPAYLKPCVPCHGGSSMETLKTFEFAIPNDLKDEFQSAYVPYSEAKRDLKAL